MRVLLSEGQSTSAREAVTALGLAGHEVEIADPHTLCFCRFSRFVHRVHRVPPIATDPRGYLESMLAILQTGRFDVLLPIHEQGYAFAKAARRVTPLAGVALPEFDAYDAVFRKLGFSRLLGELGLPQPATEKVVSIDQLKQRPFPFLIKMDIGTASRGTWAIHGPAQLEEALSRSASEAGELLVQEFMTGEVGHAQAVFAHGRMIGIHGYRPIARGAGGGAAVKESVRRSDVESDLSRIGQRLRWHGALSVDYLCSGGRPHYVDCNPRLVEPMSASLAGVDLMGMLLDVSVGREAGREVVVGRPGIRTRLAMQAVLGTALSSNSRLSIIRELFRLAAGRGLYRDAVEELTPFRKDPPSAVPLAMATLIVLVNPGFAASLPSRGWGGQLLTHEVSRRDSGLARSMKAELSALARGNFLAAGRRSRATARFRPTGRLRNS